MAGQSRSEPASAPGETIWIRIGSRLWILDSLFTSYPWRRCVITSANSETICYEAGNCPASTLAAFCRLSDNDGCA